MVPTLGPVHVDPDRVDETVGRATRVVGTDPRRSLGQEVVHLGQLDIDVAVEVDELDLGEHVDIGPFEQRLFGQ